MKSSGNDILRTYVIDGTKRDTSDYTLIGSSARAYTNTGTSDANTGTFETLEFGSEDYTLQQDGYNPNGGKTFTLEMTGSEGYELDFEGNGQNGNYDHWQNNVAGSYAKSEWGSDENGDFSEDSGDSYTADLSNQGNDVAGTLGASLGGTRYSLLELFVAGGDADTDVNGGQFITSIDGFPVQRVNPIYRPTGTREIAGDIQNKYCFVAGTLVITESARLAIETIKPGQRVWAAHEGSPEGKPMLCRVEELFTNPPAEIWEVHLQGGQVLRTTAGHLVYIKKLGWTVVKDLKAGDLFRTEQGEGLRVEKVVNTQRMEPVYNLRVAECHTYFVSADESSPAVLVHNQSWFWDAVESVTFGNLKRIGNNINFAGAVVTGNWDDAKAIASANAGSSGPGYSATGGFHIEDVGHLAGQTSDSAQGYVTTLLKYTASPLSFLMPSKPLFGNQGDYNNGETVGWGASLAINILLGAQCLASLSSYGLGSLFSFAPSGGSAAFSLSTSAVGIGVISRPLGLAALAVANLARMATSTGGSGSSGGPKIPNSSLPALEEDLSLDSFGRLHGDIPNVNDLTLEQAEQQLQQVEDSIPVREWNNGESLDQGHQMRLNLEYMYRNALKMRLGR